MKAVEILETAAKLVSGDRNKQNGDARENHANIAVLWSAWLGVAIRPEDVIAMMVLLKLARTKSGNINPDDYVDACGYASLMGQLETE